MKLCQVKKQILESITDKKRREKKTRNVSRCEQHKCSQPLGEKIMRRKENELLTASISGGFYRGNNKTHINPGNQELKPLIKKEEGFQFDLNPEEIEVIEHVADAEGDCNVEEECVDEMETFDVFFNKGSSKQAPDGAAMSIPRAAKTTWTADGNWKSSTTKIFNFFDNKVKIKEGTGNSLEVSLKNIGKIAMGHITDTVPEMNAEFRLEVCCILLVYLRKREKAEKELQERTKIRGEPHLDPNSVIGKNAMSWILLLITNTPEGAIRSNW